MTTTLVAVPPPGEDPIGVDLITAVSLMNTFPAVSASSRVPTSSPWARGLGLMHTKAHQIASTSGPRQNGGGLSLASLTACGARWRVVRSMK